MVDEEPDYQPIGGPTKLAELTRATVASIPTGSPRTSGTTGLRTISRPPSKEIGQLLGEHGAVAKLTATLDPTAEGITNLDRALYRASMSLVGSSLSVIRRPMYSDEHEGELLTIKLSIDADRDKVAEALALVEHACQPLNTGRMYIALENLYQLTAHRNPAGDDLEAQRRAYARELQEWPADVVAFVLATQASYSQWWPSWHELVKRLESRAGRRMALRRALKRRAR